MAKQLKGLGVHEVSGVDFAANGRTFLLHKSKSAAAVPPVLKGATMSKPNAALRALAKALPKTVRKGLGDDLKAMLGVDADGEVMATPEPPELMDYVEDQESDEAIVAACEALCSAIDALQDSQTLEDKKAAFLDLLDEFQGLIMGSGVLKSVGVVKAGRKISSSNMALIQQIQQLLAQLMAAAGGPPAPDAPPADGSEDPDPDGGDGTDPGADDNDPQDGVGVQMAAYRKARAARKAKRMAKSAPQKEEPVAKSAEIVELEKANASLAADIKKERDLRVRGELLTKARAIGAVPGWTVEKMADALMKADASHAADLETGWKASAEVFRKSDLTREIGSSGQAGGSADSGAQIIAKAKDLVKSGAEKSLVTAMARVTKENPDLAAEHIREQRRQRA